MYRRFFCQLYLMIFVEILIFIRFKERRIIFNNHICHMNYRFWARVASCRRQKVSLFKIYRDFIIFSWKLRFQSFMLWFYVRIRRFSQGWIFIYFIADTITSWNFDLRRCILFLSLPSNFLVWSELSYVTLRIKSIILNFGLISIHLKVLSISKVSKRIVFFNLRALLSVKFNLFNFWESQINVATNPRHGTQSLVSIVTFFAQK